MCQQFAASFRITVRCANCARETQKAVNVPAGDEAPRDMKDLLESAYWGQVAWRCRHCGSWIGRLVAMRQCEMPGEAPMPVSTEGRSRPCAPGQ